MISHAIDMAVTQAYLEYEQEHLDVKLKDFPLNSGNVLTQLIMESPSLLTRGQIALKGAMFS